MKQGKRLTLKEIAEQIGLSTATVDRVLNNRGKVKPETYRLVMEKIEELNYTPNKSASFLSRKQDMSFAVIFPEHPDYFWRQIEEGISKAYDELRDYGLHIEIFKSEKYDVQKQRTVLQEIIDSGKFHAIALAPNSSHDMSELIDLGIEKGMAVCTFNNDSPLSHRLFYVGCDYRIAGRLAADVLCKMLGKRGKVGLITSDTSTWSTDVTFQMQQKITGFREVVAEYDRIEMAGPLKLTQDEYESADHFKAYFERIDGIYVSSAKLHVIAAHLEELDLAGDIALVGHDMSKAIHRGLKNDTISATICQDPFNQGYITIKKLFDHLAFGDKGDLNENIIKLELVTKENARYYI